MEKPKRDFKGIWIPREIWLNEELNLFEKILFVEIDSLDNEDGCFASNAYFSKFFGISQKQITRYVAKLKEKGLIEQIGFDGRDRVLKSTPAWTKMSMLTGQIGASREDKNVQHNNTDNNTDNKSISILEKNKIIQQKTEEFIDEIKELFKDQILSKEVANELKRFAAYWTEPNKSRTKLKWEKQETWEMKRRIATWISNHEKFSGKIKHNKYQVQDV
jgi:DNA-binding Lrp family transcriptional regulator